MLPLACLTFAACLMLLVVGCRTPIGFAALALSIGCSTAAADDLNTITFAAMQSRGVAAVPCAATSPADASIDFASMKARQPDAVAMEPISFGVMAQRCVTATPRSGKKPPLTLEAYCPRWCGWCEHWLKAFVRDGMLEPNYRDGSVISDGELQIVIHLAEHKSGTSYPMIVRPSTNGFKQDNTKRTWSDLKAWAFTPVRQ